MKGKLSGLLFPCSSVGGGENTLFGKGGWVTKPGTHTAYSMEPNHLGCFVEPTVWGVPGKAPLP